jgi:AcrR family transcriptional regulator
VAKPARVVDSSTLKPAAALDERALVAGYTSDASADQAAEALLKRPRRKRDGSVAETFIEVGFKLWIESGDRLTTAQVARQADAAELTFFRHFGNKDAFVQQLIARLPDLLNVPAGAFQAPPSGEPGADLMQLATAFSAFVQANAERLPLIAANLKREPNQADQPLPGVREALAQASALFRHYQAKGQLAADDPDRMATAFLAPLLAPAFMGLPAPGDLARHTAAFLNGHR